jgi:hypothetical protein
MRAKRRKIADQFDTLVDQLKSRLFDGVIVNVNGYTGGLL